MHQTGKTFPLDLLTLGACIEMIKKRGVKLLQPCKLFRGGEGFKEGTKGKVELLIKPLEPHVRGGEVLYAPPCPWLNAVDRRCYQSVQAEIVDQRLKEDAQLGRLDQVWRADGDHEQKFPLGVNFMARCGQKSDLSGLCGIGYWVWSIST